MNTSIRSRILLAGLLLLPGIVAAQDTHGRFGIGGHYAFVKNRESNEDANMYGGMVRLRSRFVGVEGSVDYRRESLGGGLELTTWPVTASLMLFPVEPLYVLGGLGWYNSTLDYPPQIGLDNETDTRVGYHLGAGVEVPIAPTFRVTGDLRYQWVDYDFDTIPQTIGQVKSNYYTIHVGGLFYFQ